MRIFKKILYIFGFVLRGNLKTHKRVGTTKYIFIMIALDLIELLNTVTVTLASVLGSLDLGGLLGGL